MGLFNIYSSKQTELMREMSHKLDEINQVNQEMKKTITRIKREETTIAQRLERVEHLLEMGSYGVTREKREVQIVVSFTSYGSRIETIPLMLERIMNQTVKPDRIVMYLSKENFPGLESDLPERVLDMRTLGLEIRWCSDDMKSYKKLLPALKDFPDDIIITIDDDLYYELDMIEKLYNSYKKYPNAISAMRTHRLTFNKKKQLLPYNKWEKEYADEGQVPCKGLMATTGAGTLFPPHIFPEEIFNMENIVELCPMADDVWVMIMAMLNGVPVIPPSRKKKLRYISGTQAERLWDANMDENDIQIQKMLKVYSIMEFEDKK